MSKIAFFDFDGTITYKDTLLEFIRYCKGDAAFYTGFMLYSPYLLAFKAGIISNQVAKEKVLAHFFAKTSREEFDKYCADFAREMIPSLVRSKAVKEINKLKDEGAEVVVVTASAENWVKDWCASIGVQCIGTRMQCIDNTINGRIEGKNCHGEEKVARIKASFDLSRYSRIYCYGDTSGDKPMLALGDVQFYKPFR